MRLRIVTPTEIVVDAEALAVRAADDSGEFGILPGHADFLSVLAISVLSWTGSDSDTRHCAVKGGVITVSGGSEVAVSTREAVLDDDLDRLADTVLVGFRAAEEEERESHAEATQMHLAAIRAILAGLGRRSAEAVR